MTPAAAPFDVDRIELSGKNLIEASAGTGKTHAIATLFRRLVTEQGLEPKQILVVTFTEAATSELRERVRRELLKAEGARRGGVESERLGRALESIDEAPISTIHGFCQRVLKEHALRSGVAFDAELVPDLEELYDDVIYDFWNERVGNGSPELARALAVAKLTPAKLRALLDELRKNPRLTLVPPPDELDPVLALQHDFAGYARGELARRKEARQVLGFEDLLERLLEALAGPSGGSLGRTLRERFRAVLIDEFQDTDPTQSEIFERAFAVGEHPLFLIGDPKQAIYGFRGADVHSYLRAAEGAKRFTMGQNWRSDPGVIASVNRVFAHAGSFVAPGIEYHPVAAQPDARDLLHVEAGVGQAALDLLLVTSRNATGLIPKPKARVGVARLVAADIVRLLASDARIGNEPVTEADIAVLTRSNEECFRIQEALRERGVHSVVIGDKSVFASAEAADLEFVLQTVLEPGRASTVKRALATGLFGETGESLVALEEDPLAFQGWLARFRAWNALWVERGFMRMFRALLDDAQSAERLLAQPDGERRLTNVLHLSELLHRAALDEHLGPAALVGWLGEQRVEAGWARTEHSEIRLESDARAVRILTVHKAKGLEFRLVYCPFLWAGTTKVSSVVFHEGERVFLDIDAAKKKSRERHREQALLESFAEELRVVYVALTRAKHRTTVVWGAFNEVGASAAAYLLVPPTDKERGKVPKKTRLNEHSEARTRESLGAFEGTGSATRVRSIDWDFDSAPLERPTRDPRGLSVLSVQRPIRTWQRVDSFSALVRQERHVPADDDARDLDDDLAPAETAVVSANESSAAPPERIVLHGFPRGRVAGDFFHAIFEVIDFSTVTGEELLEVGTEKLEAYGLVRGLSQPVVIEHQAQMVRALREVLETPLAPAGGFCLRDVRMSRRFSELEFHVPVVAERAEDGGLTQEKLAAVFRDYPSAELPKDYAERVARLGFAPLSGFLKGYIDLVFVHEGRWFVVDYKTNHLSDFVGDYDSERMAVAMAGSHYFLQYHLYCLAVSRFLRRQAPGFDYARDFGGALYLFVKGMRPGRSTGIFFEKPPLERLRALSAALGSHPW